MDDCVLFAAVFGGFLSDEYHHSCGAQSGRRTLRFLPPARLFLHHDVYNNAARMTPENPSLRLMCFSSAFHGLSFTPRRRIRSIFIQ